jgi:hypothetical protein
MCLKVEQNYNTTHITVVQGESTTDLKDLPAITMALLTHNLLLPMPNKTSTGSLLCITAPPKQENNTLQHLHTAKP